MFAHVTQRWMEFMVQIGETPLPPLPSSAWPPPCSSGRTSLPWVQVAPQCPGAPPTWCPGSSCHPSCLSSPLWSPRWLETPASVSLSSICECGIPWRLSWVGAWAQGGDDQSLRPSSVLSLHPSLLLGLQSQTSSVLVPLDNWAQHPAQQLSGICCFWEGTSCSGGDQPSRVRAWPRGRWV